MAESEPEAGDQLTQDIRDQFLQCKICLDGLKEPKTLPCLHTYCADCIHYYIGHNRIDGRKFACPICRRHIYIPKGGVDGFPDSFFVTNLNDIVVQNAQKASDDDTACLTECGICKFKDEKVDATSMCVECKINLCPDCSTEHTKAAITATHTLLPVKKETVSRENYCRVHKGETVKFYCETCNTAICLPCTFLDHKGHSIVEIKNIRESFQSEMEGLVLQSEDNIIQLKAMHEDLEDLENELFVRKETIKSHIRRTVQETIRDLQEQEKQLKNQVDEYYETVAIARDRQKLKRTIYRMSHAHDFAKTLLAEETSPIIQLTHRKDAKQNLEEALKYELPDVTVHHAKMDKYVNFLRGNVDVEIGSLLKCSGVGTGSTMRDVRPRLPVTKAMFLHKLKPTEDDYTMGDVLALAFLPNNDLVVLTSEGRKVKIYTMKGDFKLDFGDDDELQHPSDLTVIREGDLAIADCGQLGVKLFTAYGTFISQFGNEEVFSLPISLTTDQLGRYIVLDQDRQRITIHSSTNGELLRDISIANIETPQMVNYHSHKLYISDFQHDTVHIHTLKDGELSHVAQLSAHGDIHTDAHFLDCSGTAIDASGNLLVSDMAVDRIHCVTAHGEMSYVVASGQQFLHPTNIAVSPNGLLAVANQANYIIESPEGGDDALELEEAPLGNHVCLYRIVKADV